MKLSRSKNIKVLLINNYSMERAYSLWKEGTSGSHHVWGKVELENRGELEMLVFVHEKHKILNDVGRWIGISHLDQQIRVLFNLKKFDILYTPYSSSNTKLLLFLKWLGLFKKPIVANIHQSLFGTRSKNKLVRWFAKKMILQYDASIFLSERLMEDTVTWLNLKEWEFKNKFSTAQWGPDVNFYTAFNKQLPSFKECTYAISAGHTDRDYETLIEAFREIDLSLRIYCTPSTVPATEDIPENVKIFSTTIPYFELLEYYKDAIAILIPLKYPPQKEGCQGMTSIQDVVALAKPVVITHNKTLNLDVKKEGFGYYVDMYDVEGWRRVVNDLKNDECKWKIMSQNAQRVYKEKFNSEIFADSLNKVFKNVYHTKVKG